MELTLIIKNEEKIFTTPFVSARFYRKLLEFDKEIDYSNLEANDYDKLIGFVCEVFGNQFTVDEFWDGVESSKLDESILNTFTFVRTGKTKQEVDEGNEPGK